jgi:hypothetical protein
MHSSHARRDFVYLLSTNRQTQDIRQSHNLKKYSNLLDYSIDGQGFAYKTFSNFCFVQKPLSIPPFIQETCRLHEKGVHEVAQFVDVESFEKLALPSLQFDPSTQVYVLDEIRRMELHSSKFKECVNDLLVRDNARLV